MPVEQHADLLPRLPGRVNSRHLQFGYLCLESEAQHHEHQGEESKQGDELVKRVFYINDIKAMSSRGKHCEQSILDNAMVESLCVL